MSKITLYTPKRDELDYRAKLMADAVTMSYNRGYDLEIPGYHKDTGCIDFPESERGEWYDAWIGNGNERFYAYVKSVEDGEFLGEVCARKNGDRYDIGVVIEAKYRGCGYGTDAIEALLAVLFEDYGAECVQNEFEFQRNAAARMHRRAHFTPVYEREGYVRYVLKREIYEELK